MSFWTRLKNDPVHPIIVHFPLAFLLTVTPLQAWRLASGSEFSGLTAIFLLKGGLMMALPTMLAGGWDFYRMIVRAGRKDVLGPASAHVMCMMTALTFYFSSLLFRDNAVTSFMLSLCGAATLSVGGWLGGTLVYRHRIGVSKE